MVKMLKHKTGHFTITSNKLVRDGSLSWKARGIFQYLWSQHEEWNFYETEVETHAPDGRDALRSGLKELESHHYLKRIRPRDHGKVDKSVWILSDKPMLENPTQDYTTLSNTKVSNTKSSSQYKNDHLSDSSTENNNSNGDSNQDKLVEHAKAVIDLLNEKADKHFRYSKSSMRFIKARLRDGYDSKDFGFVITNKSLEWKNSDMNKYLRPTTLFTDEHMNNYLNEKPRFNTNSSHSDDESSDDAHDDVSEEDLDKSDKDNLDAVLDEMNK